MSLWVNSKGKSRRYPVGCGFSKDHRLQAKKLKLIPPQASLFFYDSQDLYIAFASLWVKKTPFSQPPNLRSYVLNVGLLLDMHRPKGYRWKNIFALAGHAEALTTAEALLQGWLTGSIWTPISHLKGLRLKHKLHPTGCFCTLFLFMYFILPKLPQKVFKT